jgi:ATP-dependent helicase/nuclease subunit B
VRTGGATHHRARILGAIEARLVRADRLILAGLEEGVWPRGAPVDPFLSRPMRRTLGLPAPERRVGLSAHDFAQAACAPEVILLHSERREGAPAVKSRWLWRLETLARGAGTALPQRPEVLAWARALDRPESFAPASRPKPTPPVEARPRSLFVTQVERWVRDPYAVYARHILKLKRLERPAEPFEAAARGSAIHKALERFTEEWPHDLPEDCMVVLRERLVAELDSAGMGEIAMVRERTLAMTCAQWLAGFELRRRDGARLLVEQTGSLTFEAPGGPFTVSAKADRIEVRADRADVLDFKTGQAPTDRQIDAGFSPQLTLTAAILAHGGFAGVDAPPGELGYIRVTGRKPPGQELIRVAASQSPAAADKALSGLKTRVARFDDAATPYLSWAAPQFLGQLGGDYDQLARLWEWHVIGTDEDEAP